MKIHVFPFDHTALHISKHETVEVGDLAILELETAGDRYCYNGPYIIVEIGYESGSHGFEKYIKILDHQTTFAWFIS